MVDSPALAELSARVRGAGAGAAAGLTVEASLSRIARRMEQQAADERECQRAVQPVLLPALRMIVTGGVPVQDPAQSLLGPEDGQVWDVRRLTVDGLVGSSGGTAQAAEGSVTSPAANATIAQITAANLTPGTYLVNWEVDLDGTPGAGDVNNFKLSGASSGLSLISVNDGVVGHYVQDQVQITIPATNASALSIKAIAAGTAGAIYSGQISLVPVPGDQVTVYREIGGAGNGNPENRLHTFTAAGEGAGPDWNPGGGLILRSPEQLLVAGSGLSAAAVTLSGEAIQVAAPWLWKYLL